MADFRRFFTLARALQISLVWPTDGPAAEIWRHTMTLSLNIQQLAVSVLGALVASSLFISAAVGPVPVI